MHSLDATPAMPSKQALKQEDFLAQLTQVLRQYDHDGDGLLSVEQWQRVSQDLQNNV